MNKSLEIVITDFFRKFDLKFAYLQYHFSFNKKSLSNKFLEKAEEHFKYFEFDKSRKFCNLALKCNNSNLTAYEKLSASYIAERESLIINKEHLEKKFCEEYKDKELETVLKKFNEIIDKQIKELSFNALHFAEKCVEINPSYGNGYFFIGLANYLVDNDAVALQNFIKALKCGNLDEKFICEIYLKTHDLEIEKPKDTDFSFDPFKAKYLCPFEEIKYHCLKKSTTQSLKEQLDDCFTETREIINNVPIAKRFLDSRKVFHKRSILREVLFLSLKYGTSEESEKNFQSLNDFSELIANAK